MPLKQVWQRVFKSDSQVGFQVLKSTSAVELHYFDNSNNSKRGNIVTRAPFPRYYSQYDDLAAVQPPTQPKTVISDVRVMKLTESTDEDESTVFFSFLQISSKPLGIIPEHQGDTEAGDYLLGDTESEAALATCHALRAQPDFREGILLRCMQASFSTCSDNEPSFPYLHYALFKNKRKSDSVQTENSDYNLLQQFSIDKSVSAASSKGISSLGVQRAVKAAQQIPGTKHTQAVYDEIYSIVKTSDSFNTRLPTNRYTGYIVLAFKVLSGCDSSLERSWLDWSGAREIYKYCPRAWSMRRITLHRARAPTTSQHGGDNFALVLLCEFSNILRPEHIAQACDTVERLKARECGFVGLYKVQWAYGRQASTVDSTTVDLSTMTQQNNATFDMNTDSEILKNSRKNADLEKNANSTSRENFDSVPPKEINIPMHSSVHF